MSEKPYVAVIGGMNMDIFGIPDEKVIPRTAEEEEGIIKQIQIIVFGDHCR